MSKPILTVVIASVALGGCAEMTHLTRQRSAGENEYVLIDAKQRALVSRSGISCAEPSPDALSAIAASQSLNLSMPQGTNLAQSLAIAESAGSIGLRTQSIQILRDHMFRVCEAFQNGQISELEAALLQRRFQTTVVSILAIEQLTGAVRGPGLVLGGSAEAGDAEAIVRLTESREKQVAIVNTARIAHESAKNGALTAQQQVDAATTALAGATDANRAALQEDLNKKTSSLEIKRREESQAEGNLLAAQSGLAAIDRALSLAGATGSASAGGEITYDGGRQPGEISAVATAVQAIVQGTYNLGTRDDFCVMVLARAVEQQFELKQALVKEAGRLAEVGQGQAGANLLAVPPPTGGDQVTERCLATLGTTTMPVQ